MNAFATTDTTGTVKAALSSKSTSVATVRPTAMLMLTALTFLTDSSANVELDTKEMENPVSTSTNAKKN